MYSVTFLHHGRNVRGLYATHPDHMTPQCHRVIWAAPPPLSIWIPLYQSHILICAESDLLSDQSVTGLVVQAGGVQGGDQLSQTLLVPVHLPVSSHEEAPGRHGRLMAADTRWGGEVEAVVVEVRRMVSGWGTSPAAVYVRCCRKYQYQHRQTSLFFLFGFLIESNSSKAHYRPLVLTWGPPLSEQ